MAKVTLTDVQNVAVRKVIGCLLVAGNLNHTVKALTPEESTSLHELLQAQILHGLNPDLGFEDPRFTEADKKQMLDLKEEEVRDCLREVAHDMLMDEELVELIGYCDDDCDQTAKLLVAIHDGDCCIMDFESGEHEEHETAAAFMRRMQLVDEAGEITDLGKEYMGRWS